MTETPPLAFFRSYQCQARPRSTNRPCKRRGFSWWGKVGSEPLYLCPQHGGIARRSGWRTLYHDDHYSAGFRAAHQHR